jgi:protein SCO1
MSPRLPSAVAEVGKARNRGRRRQRGRGWFLALTSSVLLLAACGSGSVPAPSQALGQQLDLQVPPTILHTNLVSSSGQHLDLGAFRGKVLVISVMMTLCQEVCPLDTANVVASARAVERAGLGDKVQFASITIDPQRDTPARLRAYRRLYAPAPADWTLLTGDKAALSGLWRAFGVYVHKVPEQMPAAHDWLTGKPLTYDLSHSDQVFFVDGRGHLRFFLDGVPHVAKGAPMPPRIQRFMSSTGHRNVNHPPSDAWDLPQALEVVSWLTDHQIPQSANQ